MAENVVNPPPRKRRGWLRVLAGIFIVLVVLLVAVYFIGTSSAFFKGFILPRVSKSLNAQVTVADAQISPFKQVILKDLKVQTTGTEPLLSAREVRARYSLMDIIGGKINVDEVSISSPIITLVENPDGSSNLDPITKAQKPEAAKEKNKSVETKASKPSRLDIKKIALIDATIRKVKLYKDGKQDTIDLSHVNLSVDDLKNGQTGKLDMSGEAKIVNNPPAPGTNGVLQAKMNGNFVFALKDDLKPTSIKGNTHLEVSQASGSMADLASLSSDLGCELTPTEIRQLALRFQKGGTQLGEVRVSGPLDLDKMEGKLKVEIASIDKQVLNLAGASSGLDFGTTTLNSTNEIQIANGAKVITASGQLNLNKLQVTRNSQTTPSLDLQTSYGVTVDQAAQTALLKTFTLVGNQQGKSLLRGELTSPMTVSWGNVSNAVGDSALNIAITDLNIADWKPFVGDSVSSGIVNLTLKLTAQQAGNQLGFDLNTKVDNLSAGDPTNQFTQAGVAAQVRGRVLNMKKVTLAEYKAQVSHKGQEILSASGSGTYDLDSKNADLQILMQATLSRLSEFAPPGAELAISSGTLNLKGRVTQTQSAQNIIGTLSIEKLTGKASKNQFQNFGLTMDLDVARTPTQIDIRKANGKLTDAGEAGGSFELSGTYATNQTAQLTAKLMDFNQNGLRPFLEPMLTDKKLTSVSLNANASIQSSPQGDAAIKADLQVTNLVVKDPNNQIPATPLEAKMQMDLGIVKKQADLKLLSLTLTPTKRGKNELHMQGKVDMSQTNYQGNLQIAADSLDFTTYYDLFAGKKNEAEKTAPSNRGGAPAPSTTASIASSGAEEEPAAQHLPFRDFNASVNIGRFYLREVEITNLQTTAKFTGSKLLLDPFKLALNGAPINATVNLDLGVPGYKYDTSASLVSVPLEPLVNTFQPERKGQIKGTLTATAKISGAGTTGANLQKNLTGQFDIGSTNLQMSVNSIQNKVLRSIVEVVSILPELVSNPANLAGSVLQGLTGKSGSSGGLSAAMHKSPIDTISAKGSAGSGKILLQQAVVQSVVFRAEVSGTVSIAPVLTNSPIELPVAILLERSVAQASRLETVDTGSDAKYAQLPTFLTMRGTLGDPKKDINKKVLLSMAAKEAGALGLGGTKAGNALQGVGELLGGRSSSTSTNEPATNKTPVVNDLLNQFLKPRKK